MFSLITLDERLLLRFVLHYWNKMTCLTNYHSLATENWCCYHYCTVSPAAVSVVVVAPDLSFCFFLSVLHQLSLWMDEVDWRLVIGFMVFSYPCCGTKDVRPFSDVSHVKLA